MVIVGLLAPLFVLIALGALLYRVGLMPAELITGLNRLLYWVGLPAVVFHSLATAAPARGAVGPLLAVLLVATAVNVALAWVEAAGLRLPASARGTFVQAAFRGNLSFIGLPLLLTVPGVPQAPAVLAVGLMLIVNNTVAVAALLVSQQASSWRRMAAPMARELVRNPIILATLAGAAWHHARLVLPVVAERTLGALAQMTLPLALLCIGGALLAVPLRGNRRAATLAALHKAALSPLIGYACGWWIGVDGPTMLAALLCLACPTAAVSYTMVKEIGGDEALAASTVVLSSLFAAPALAVVLAWFGS